MIATWAPPAAALGHRPPSVATAQVLLTTRVTKNILLPGTPMLGLLDGAIEYLRQHPQFAHAIAERKLV